MAGEGEDGARPVRRVYIEKANGKLRPLTHYGLYRLAWADVRRARKEMPKRY